MTQDIELPWSEFKTQVLDTGHFSWVHFTRYGAYVIFAKQNNFSAFCKINLDSDLDDKLDFEENYLPRSGAILKSKVITELESDDKTLGLVSTSGEFDGSECHLEIKVPGEVGQIGRYVKEGYAFSDKYTWGMRVESVALVDKDFVYKGLAYPSTPTEAGLSGVEGLQWEDILPLGVPLGEYCDEVMPEINRGWRMWAEEGGQGGCDIDNLAGYGSLYGAAYLVLKFTKPEGSDAQFVSANISWGVQK